jgi:predicted ester cyclase
MRYFVSAVLAAGVLTACQPADTSSEWQPIMDAYIAAWNTGDFSGLDAVVSPDIVRHINSPATSSVGLDSLRISITATRTTYPDFHGTVEELVTAGDRATWRFVVTGTHDSLGTQTTATGVSVFRKVDGMLVEDLAVWDGLAWYQGLGYTLAPPSDPEG